MVSRGSGGRRLRRRRRHGRNHGTSGDVGGAHGQNDRSCG